MSRIVREWWRRRIEIRGWPRTLPALDPDQHAIRELFVERWLTALPQRYGFVERRNHTLVAQTTRSAKGDKPLTLEIGAGLGAHLPFERLDDQRYITLDLRPELMRRLVREHAVAGVAADVEGLLPFRSGTFDRVVAIHVLEHLPNLPVALLEIGRVLRKGGVFEAVVPCEGGVMYEVGRTISARRMFEREHGGSYDWFVRSEHVSRHDEIMAEVKRFFILEERRDWPARFGSIDLNLITGFRGVPLG